MNQENYLEISEDIDRAYHMCSNDETCMIYYERLLKLLSEKSYELMETYNMSANRDSFMNTLEELKLISKQINFMIENAQFHISQELQIRNIVEEIEKFSETITSK